MFCLKCGNQLPDDAQFCNKCGNKTIQFKPQINTNIQKANSTSAIPKKDGITLLCIILIILVFLLYINSWNKKHKTDDAATTEITTQVQTTVEQTTEQTISLKDQFISEMGETNGTKVYEILTNDIGYSDKEIEIVNREGDTYNWKVKIGINFAMITALDEIRIWIPNTDYIFYENGEVKLTKEQYTDDNEKREVSSSEMTHYYVIAQNFITPCLKNQSSAKYQSVNSAIMKKYENTVIVQSKVTSKNDFNAKVTSDFTVEFTVNDLDNFDATLLYLNIEGQTIGEYVELP